MLMLVTLDEVKAALHITHDDDDATLQLFIAAASQAVVNFLDTQAHVVLGYDSPAESPYDSPPATGTAPPEVKAATIILTGHLFRDPDGNSGNPDMAFQNGWLPRPVVALLYPLRDPAVA